MNGLTLLFSKISTELSGEWGRAIVADGFTALAGMPQWYQIALGAIKVQALQHDQQVSFLR